MAYSSGPYSTFTSLPSPDRPEVSTARKIDFALGRFVFADDGTGGFEKMSSTAQRVALLVAYALKKPSIITPQTMAKLDQDIRTILEPLTRQPSPVIEIKSIDVTHSAAGALSIDVAFRELETNADNTVQLV